MSIYFLRSTEMKVNVKPGQNSQLSTPDEIKKACDKSDVIAYDIYKENKVIGFAMLRKHSENGFFLWNFAIDKLSQGKKYGYNSLLYLAKMLKEDFKANEMTTTYIYGNEIAEALYKKAGFVEVDVVDEPNCQIEPI